MARPVTLFTGQCADLSLAELAPLAKQMGYDGLELACWADHFEVQKALHDKHYVPTKHALLEKHGLARHAISNHLVGQAVCDPIDERHKDTARAAAFGVGVVPGGTKSAAFAKNIDFAPSTVVFDAAFAGEES